MDNLFYTAPTDRQFNEVKKKAIKIWKTYDNTYGYVDEKVDRIKNIKNVQDNFMFIVAMFDQNNQSRLALVLSAGTKKAVSDRIKAGGSPDEYNEFI